MAGSAGGMRALSGMPPWEGQPGTDRLTFPQGQAGRWRPLFEAAAMQFTVPDLIITDALQTTTTAVRALDPGATVAADVSRRQLHSAGRFEASAAIAALLAAGMAATLSTSGHALSALAPMPLCRCGCVFGGQCRCR